MELSLKNIGKIGSADVEFNGITVIAGENDTGKSTVGKALFSIFNSLYQIRKRIEEERKKSVQQSCYSYLYRNNRANQYSSIEEDIGELVVNIDFYKKNPEILEEKVFGLLQNEEGEKESSEDSIHKIIHEIKEILEISDERISRAIIQEKLSQEFYRQINNIFTESIGEIKLLIKDQSVTVKVKNNMVIESDGLIELQTEAVYLDDPFVLDEITRGLFDYYIEENHRKHLKEKLLQKEELSVIDGIILNNKLEEIYKKINIVCDGDMVENRQRRVQYKEKGTEKLLDLKNLSMGLKTFVILKILLKNKTVDYNSTMILDEPEIHLHPEWQLILAELIVLFQKEFHMQILINTHSPYFLNAIEVYAAKYEIEDQCKYYLTEVEDGISYVKDVTDNIEVIYAKLARPLQTLENERYCHEGI